MSKEQPHVLVIGAGFAGLAVAHRLRKAPVRVTLVDKNNYHLFQPLLYQVATSGLNPSEISAVVRSNFRKRKNIRVLKAEMSELDREKKVATFDHGKFELEYDFLVLCAGGKTCYFGNDQWEVRAPGLKSLDDAVTIRNRLLESYEQAEQCDDPEEVERLTTMVIIGGGPTGVELAGAFAELRSKVLNQDFRSFDPKKARVILVEGGPQLLNGYDPKLGAYTKKRLEKVGVEVLMEQRVTDITDQGVVTEDGILESRNIIWAAGVEGHPLADQMGDERDRRGRVVIEPDLRVKGEEDVYACGDMACFMHDERFPHGLPGVAQVAMQQGDLAARNILARLKGKPVNTFRYFDKGKMATIGRSAAVAESGPFKLRGILAWFAWLFIHVIYLVEFQDRLFVFFRWLWAYCTWHWGVRIIFRAKEEPLPELEGPESSPDPCPEPSEVPDEVS